MSTVRLGSFETIREVGAGGMGTVWEGRHVVTGASVAVKFLTSERARDPRWLAAFQSEARAIARLGHPRVVRIHDVGTIPTNATLEDLPAGSPYIVMEWVSKSLATVPQPLAWDNAKAVLLEVLDALAHVHARGIVHRDIKPSNVLGRIGRLRLADFGIARLDGQSDENSISGLSGTPYFMAPEQFTSSAGSVAGWTDLYAVGCLAYLLVTGQPPFQGASAVELAAQHVKRPFPLSGFDERLKRWLINMTAKNPAARYRFATESARELATIDRAYEDASLSPTERWISPGETASETLPLTTVILDAPVAAAVVASDPRRAPTRSVAVADWRMPAAIRSHIEHAAGSGLAVSTMRVPPFVGREAERDEMWSAFGDALLAGRGSATLINGPPGVGKSRLARWLAERTHELALCAHLGPVSCRTTDEPFLRLALDELGVEPTHGERIRERVMQRLDGSDVSSAEENAIVNFLSGKLFAASTRDRFGAMQATLAACGAGAPLLVLLDDFEDAPGEVLEAVYQTLRSGAPIHFVMTATVPLPDPRQRLRTVELAPLEDTYMGRIVRDLAGLHPDLTQQVVTAARGNPGYAIRLVHGLVERGALRGGEHGYELQSQIELEVPQPAQLWEERLETLVRDVGHTARSALELAAVLGNEVVDAEWHAVAGAASVFLPDVLKGELEQRGFSIRTTRGWAFADRELRRLVVQSAQDRNTWKTYIAAARQALPDAETERLAIWNFEAGRTLSAAQGFLDAAKQAKRLSEDTRAARLLQRVEKILAASNDSDEAPRLSAEVDVLKASIWGAERLDAADDLAACAAAAADENGWDDVLARALEQRGAFARKRVDLATARTFYVDARDAYERCGDADGVGLALQGLGMVAVSTGDLKNAEQLYNDALAVLMSIENLRGAAWCANGLGDVYRKQGELGLADSWYQRARNWFETVGHPYGVMWCTHDLGLLQRDQGDLDAAVELLEQTVAMARRLGQRVVAPRLNLGLVQVMRGEERLARPVFEEVIEESRLRSVAGEEGLGLACLLACDAADGRWEELRGNLALAQQKLGDLVDSDLGEVAKRAAERAAAAGEQALADELTLFASAHGVG